MSILKISILVFDFQSFVFFFKSLKSQILSAKG